MGGVIDERQEREPDGFLGCSTMNVLRECADEELCAGGEVVGHSSRRGTCCSGDLTHRCALDSVPGDEVEGDSDDLVLPLRWVDWFHSPGLAWERRADRTIVTLIYRTASNITGPVMYH